ncbi:MAG: insulinase family protein [Bacilli bacterium]|nr:insulinase family protein [Bacilli bacterium]
MNYIKKEMNNYNIYFIKTKKFKTITISFNLCREMNNEDSVYRNLLKKVLLHGTKMHPNLDKLCKARMDIYDPSINIGASESGLERVMYLDTTFVNEKYTEKGMNKKSIEFALSYIFEPYVKDGAFDKKIFELAKHEFIENMKAVKDNSDSYAKERVWEEMNVYPFDEFNIEDAINFAQTLNEKDLFEYYQTLFNENSLDIFVAGDVDEDEITKIIDSVVKGNFIIHGKRHNISRKANKLKVVTDKTNNEQSKLAIGIRYEDLTDFERKYVSLAYNNILGGGWNSKLNKVVREQNSLCYYIYATRKIPFGISLIYSGIDANNYEKAVDLIKNEIENMKTNISEEELDRVKDIYNNALISIEDTQFSIVNNVIGQVFAETDSIDERKINMEKVTLEDVKNLAKKVKVEVVYLLEGDINGKENL